MIAANLYYPICMLLVVVLTLAMCMQYSHYTNRRLLTAWKASQGQMMAAVTLVVFLSLFLGFRPISGRYFGDTASYALDYERQFGWFDPNNISGDWLFNYIMGWMAGQSLPIAYFFTTINALYFGLMYLACLKMFPRDSLFAFVIYLGAFSTFSYGVNGLRAGMAASIFLCALAWWRNKAVVVALCIASFLTHHAMMLPICAMACVWFMPFPKLWMTGWVVALFVALLHITWFQDLFAMLSDDVGEGYLATENTGEWGGTLEGRFRYDFVLYSAIPLWVAWRAMKRLRRPSPRYKAVFNCYTLCNTVWMLCMFANFTNRIAYLSWFLLPILLVYPYFRQEFISKQYKEVNTVAILHLGFTIFMWLVYYQLR